jgi:preprotein translocase SecE subunit
VVTVSKSAKPGPSSAPSASLPFAAYLKGVAEEWKKIQWPKPVQIAGQTLVVLVMVTLFSTLLWLFDNVFRLLLQLLVQRPV